MSRAAGTIEISRAAIAAWPLARTAADVREIAPVAGHYLVYAPGVDGLPGYLTVARLEVTASGFARRWYWPAVRGGPATDAEATEWRIGPRIDVVP